MALTAKQRNALPASAFVYPKARKYPVPTKAQARKAGIGERARQGVLRSALSRAGQKKTAGSYSMVAKKVKSRAGGSIAAVSGPRGTTARAGLRRRRR